MMFDVDYEKLVSRGDLHYKGTVPRSHHGLPIGNGRMGSLVWTSPHSLKLQVNHVEVYGNSCESMSFNQRNTDYSYGCGLIDIDFGDLSGEVFPANGTTQRLGLYDAVASIQGNGVSVRALAYHKEDLFAFELSDHRSTPQPICIRLKAMRPMDVRFKEHSAISEFSFTDQKYVAKPDTKQSGADTDASPVLTNASVSLIQRFSEKEFFCSSCLSITAIGRDGIVRFNDESGGLSTVTGSKNIPGLCVQTEQEIRLVLPPQKGTVTVLIAAAATFLPDDEPAVRVKSVLDRAMKDGFAGLLAENMEWWHEFWQRSFVFLESVEQDDDSGDGGSIDGSTGGSTVGEAEFVEQHYTYYQYVLACCSRGRYAPRYGGMLFSTHGDKRAWGAQQWWTNLSLYYRGMLPANRPEIVEPVISHYFGMREACARAAEQQWRSKGIYYPETVWFDGLEALPEDIAEEMQALYLLEKPWETRSTGFWDFAIAKHPHNSRWNWKGIGRWTDGHWSWIYGNRNPPFSPVNHFFATGAEIAALCWKRYDYTRDREWLRDKGYPILKGVCEFFRNFPNFKKGTDGKYHVHHVNDGEHIWGGQDTMDVICGVRGILPMAVRASEILGVDPELREAWREFLENMAPLPTSSHPDSIAELPQGSPEVFVDGLKPYAGGRPRPGIDQFNGRFYDNDLISLETADVDPETFEIAMNTYRSSFPDGLDQETALRVMSGLAPIAARLGLPEDVRHAMLNQLKVLDPAWDFCDFEGAGGEGVLMNRLTNREGGNAIGAQRLGNVAYALHESLIQSLPPSPGGDPVIRLFPAFPKGWNGAFTLAARGGFLVSSAQKHGIVVGVEIRSRIGGTCRIRNPWSADRVILTRRSEECGSEERNGEEQSTLHGELLVFETDPGDTILLTQEGEELSRESLRIAP